MKKIVLFFCLATLLLSCSAEDTSTNSDNTISVSSIIRKNYNATTDAVLSTIQYTIGNNKIMSVTGTNAQNTQQTNSVYTYLSNKITQITTSTNGVVTSNQYFVYNSANKLIEYRTESVNSSGEIQVINKNTFDRVQDTIYNYWTRKTSPSNDFSPIITSKIVLDENHNRTFFEYYDHLNNEFKKETLIYDAQNNIIQENHFIYDGGQFVNTLTNNYNYSNTMNTLAYVLAETYGKETLMLFYHLQTGAINEINVKSYSPNTLANYTTTFSNDLSFTFSSTGTDANYSNFSEYKTYVAGVLFTKFTYNFSFN